MKRTRLLVICYVLSFCLAACSSLKYSPVGIDIPAGAETICIKQFQNNASLVNLKLSNELTTQLKDKFQSNTRLSLVDSRGDLYLEGEITNYAITPAALGADMATTNRLTITVKIKYENRFDEEKDLEQTFSRYMDFNSNQTLPQVEDVLVFQICEALVDDIFAATVGNW
ncbi:MAG: LPS assembly lipoprotein LptE [Bacteroidales bacterium]|jgi:predicted small secreted protein|nr:LPS assembly lipoprotein LptE [Bacteroidales bacterium]